MLKKLTCVNGGSTACEKSILLLKKHFRKMDLQPVQKAIVTLIKIKYFGIMHRYGSYIFIVLLRHYTVIFTFVSLINQKVK